MILTILLAVQTPSLADVETTARTCLVQQATKIAKGSKETAETIFDVARNRCDEPIKSVGARALVAEMQGNNYQYVRGASDRAITRFLADVRPAILDAIITAR